MADIIPWEIRLTLRPGSVYYFVDRSLTSSEPHYFIVVNARPLEQQILILAVVTSQVEKIRARRIGFPSTTVEISPSEYDELNKPSIVDCNVVFRRSLRELIEKTTRGEIAVKKDLPSGVLTAIKKAIVASPLVEEETKKLLK